MPNELTLNQIERSVEAGKKRYDKMYPWEDEILEEFKKEFRSHFIQSPEILYVLRMPHNAFGAHLEIGFAEADLTADQLKTTENIARKIVSRKDGKNCLTIKCKEIPEDGEFLLFDAAQAYAIAKNLKTPNYSEFDRLEVVYLEVLQLQKISSNKGFQHCFQILTELANHYANAGHQRKGIECVKYAAETLRIVLVNTEGNHIDKEVFVEQRITDIERLNYIFSHLEVPENGAQWTSIFLSLLEKRFGPIDQIWRWSLCNEIENLSNHADDIQTEIMELNNAVQAARINI